MTQLDHPQNPLPDEVKEALRRNHEQEMAAGSQQLELVNMTRPTNEERASRFDFLETAGKALGLDTEKYRAQSSALRKNQIERLRSAEASEARLYSEFTPVEFEPPAPRETDTTFWFSHFEVFATPPYQAEALSDGFHFRGKKTYDGTSLIHLTFGEKCVYAISADRIPPSPSNRWRSAPHVELFGELLAWTGDPGIFSGDFWSKCWMIRRQTLFQFTFGGMVKIGERIEAPNIFHEEDANRTVTHRLPGFQPMPAIDIDGLFGGVTLFAELEVRFDIQLEGDSLLWIHPSDLLIRGFQWPLIPL